MGEGGVAGITLISLTRLEPPDMNTSYFALPAAALTKSGKMGTVESNDGPDVALDSAEYGLLLGVDKRKAAAAPEASSMATGAEEMRKGPSTGSVPNSVARMLELMYVLLPATMSEVQAVICQHDVRLGLG